MKKHGGDRRRFVRVGKKLKLGYRIVNAKDNYRRVFSKDISGGGIKVAFKELPREGSYIDLDVELSEEKKKFNFKGKVIWTKSNVGDETYPFVAGLEFVDVDSSVRTMLSNYVQYLNRQELIREYFK